MRNITLMTDLYELTMAQGYWKSGHAHTQACFYAFFRENPFGGGYSIFCGLDQVARLIEDFCVTEQDIEYLASLDAPAGGKLFDREFLDWLASTPLNINIDAVQEGSVVFPREPLIRVTGNLWQCQLLESALLNSINFQTLIATKAARICKAARGKPVSEFGLRRAQGWDGALSASRAAYIGGCANTANVLAGKDYGIPVSGTHAHSWVMAFDSELEAFRAYAKAFPQNAVLLVDTYNVETGVKNAVTVAKELEKSGNKLLAIRIDSGDLAWLSKKARKMLDEANLPDVGIVLSNDLDEYTITSLNEQGAEYSALGVGTRLITAADQPALGGVYKLSAVAKVGQAGQADQVGQGELQLKSQLEPKKGAGQASQEAPKYESEEARKNWRPCIKVSENSAKITIPGLVNTRRYYNEDGTFAGDLIFDELQCGLQSAPQDGSQSEPQNAPQDGSQSEPQDAPQDFGEHPCARHPLDDTRRKEFSPNQKYETLLKPFVRDGQVIGALDLQTSTSRKRCKQQLGKLDESIQRFMNPHEYPAGIESSLYERRMKMILKARQK